MSPSLLLLLSLLLLGSLGVCAAAPLDKDEEHPEEMVTRCIVEVLSNALAKPNAPPIDPECREILEKSSRHNQDEKENEVKQYETRNLKNVAITDGHHHKTSEEAKPENQETTFPEEEKKWHHTENESQEENEKRETKHVKDNEEDTGHSKERDFVDEVVERIHHKEHIQSEEVSKEDREQAETSHENRHDITDEKVHEAAKSLEEASEEDARNLEDIMKRHHDNWKEQAKESDQSEDEEERRYKPNHGMFGQRFLGYEEKRSHYTNQIDSSEQTEDEEKRHNTLNAFEDNVKKNHYEAKGHNDIQSSEESKEKIHLHNGREEVRDQSYDSEDNSKEYQRHPNTEEERHHEEKKRWPMEQSEEDKLNYEHSQEDNEESEEDIEKRHAKDRKLKEELFEKLRHHLLEGSDEQPYTHERKAEDKKHYVSEAMGEVKRNYPERDEEKKYQHYNDEWKSHHYGNNKDDFQKSNYFDNEKYKRHHPEYERRINRYGFPDEIKWKNRFYDKEEDDHTYDSEEENKNNLQNKNVFPEFSDYDWWEKKQLLDGMNHGYAEKRSSPKMHKFDMKRQYDRMDQLAQLLNYKKKSVEFPDFYDSEEIKKRHLNDRGSLGQRPLTEEEEKDLENLAIMDLELQKIAEKLSNSRQG